VAGIFIWHNGAPLGGGENIRSEDSFVEKRMVEAIVIPTQVCSIPTDIKCEHFDIKQ